VNGIQCPHWNRKRLQRPRQHWPDHFNHRNPVNQIPNRVAMRIGNFTGNSAFFGLRRALWGMKKPCAADTSVQIPYEN
jgi:hypothetical protein